MFPDIPVAKPYFILAHERREKAKSTDANQEISAQNNCRDLVSKNPILNLIMELNNKSLPYFLNAGSGSSGRGFR